MVMGVIDVSFVFQVLFRFAVAIFKYAENRILACTDYISANQYLRELGSKMSDTERLVYVAFHEINPFPIRYITSRRAHHLEEVRVR